ncbi:MAG: hypothetical protein DMD56_08875 [Gemmatimonadetes bacterium]|nr:MAG: hypothetical protein DMD56_08875 [Gemmatimonadota bacterium]
MSAHLEQWLNLVLRWAHVITGIAWIGTSFYFNWLNSRLVPLPPERREPGVAGELWSVHGGGFYRVVKYTVAPAELPRTLHWFKWEAYATWLTGFALLVLVYYIGAASFLVDPQRARVSAVAGVAVAVATLIVSWLGYDALCRSALGARPLALAATLFVLATALAWGLTELLSPRAAYLHVGAWFNLRNQGRNNVWILPAAALAMVALALVTAPRSGPALPSVSGQVSFADVRPIVARRCAGCHSSAPTTPGIPAAPLGVRLDTPDEIRANAPRILAVAVDAQTMPLGNVTGMTAEERDVVGRWIRAGAPLR